MSDWTRDRLLRLQFAKLVNLHPQELVTSWGGLAMDGQPRAPLEAAYARFAEAAGEAPWVHRIDLNTPWGPGNVAWNAAPSAELRSPFEAYLTAQGVTVTLATAAKVLGTSADKLLHLKLSTFSDDAVLMAVFKEQYGDKIRCDAGRE